MTFPTEAKKLVLEWFRNSVTRPAEGDALPQTDHVRRAYCVDLMGAFYAVPTGYCWRQLVGWILGQVPGSFWRPGAERVLVLSVDQNIPTPQREMVSRARARGREAAAPAGPVEPDRAMPGGAEFIGHFLCREWRFGSLYPFLLQQFVRDVTFAQPGSCIVLHGFDDRAPMVIDCDGARRMQVATTAPVELRAAESDFTVVSYARMFYRAGWSVTVRSADGDLVPASLLAVGEAPGMPTDVSDGGRFYFWGSERRGAFYLLNVERAVAEWRAYCRDVLQTTSGFLYEHPVSDLSALLFLAGNDYVPKVRGLSARKTAEAYCRYAAAIGPLTVRSGAQWVVFRPALRRLVKYACNGDGTVATRVLRQQARRLKSPYPSQTQLRALAGNLAYALNYFILEPVAGLAAPPMMPPEDCGRYGYARAADGAPYSLAAAQS